MHVTSSGCPASIVFVPGRRGGNTFCRPARGPITLVRCLVQACASRNSIMLSGYVKSNAATITTVHAKQRCVKFRVRRICYRVTRQQVRRRLRYEGGTRRRGRVERRGRGRWVGSVSGGKVMATFLLTTKLLKAPGMRTRQACRRVRRLAMGRRMAAIVATSRPMHFISVSASGIINSRPVSGVIHLGPGRNKRRSNRILTVIAVMARHCHARCTLLCAAQIQRTMASGRVRLRRQGTCRGPTISVSAIRVAHFTQHV